MKFEKKLLQGQLLQRYKRFFADVELQGKKYTIHVPNTGSLKGVIDKNQQQLCWFSLHGDKSKKLQGTLEAVQTRDGTWVGVNTSHPNRIVQEAIQLGLQRGKAHLSHWQSYDFYKSEYKVSKETRLDGVFVKNSEELEYPNSQKHFIEIKNTTLLRMINGKKVAQFPDTVTERGQKHLVELIQLMKSGHRAELIFAIQRADAQFFSVAEDLDPNYAKLFKKAIDAGLIVSPMVVEISQNEIFLTKKVLKLIP